eukprot:TRINITY_DN11787_c0_g1_i1.p2 TRINITY_DN11787_c0_g1~~TRINITY_DN11787_c0_g1_i1.p2  ORF type:complete len:157 (-),score=37.79 TRINITY_DN11787_c0_g1_i1:246-677(-)
MQDRVRESVVVFLGTIARHMEPGEPKVLQVVEKLMDALHIPSEIVQRAVAQCLAPIMSGIKDKAEGYINSLLERVAKGKNYGDRRGAAFGLAGVIKGVWNFCTETIQRHGLSSGSGGEQEESELQRGCSPCVRMPLDHTGKNL